MTYVALGDSYASGEGIPPYEAGANGCRRSARSYPTLLAADGGGVETRLAAAAAPVPPPLMDRGARDDAGEEVLVPPGRIELPTYSLRVNRSAD